MAQRKARRAGDVIAEQVSLDGPAGFKRFGELLRRHRRAAGISQEYLAERARLSTAAISALEQGTRQGPYRYTVALLADALGLSFEQRAELESAAERGRARNTQPASADSNAVHNLPTQLTSFVGREAQVDEICQLLGGARLVSLTGPGGVGKTRLALQVAQRLLLQGYRREVKFVDLAPVREGHFLIAKIAAVLGVPIGEGGDALDALTAAIRGRQLLLILDNCEHLVAAAAAAANAMLHRCPHIAVLSTSRERLGISAETVYRLSSLALPDDVPESIEQARSFGALELFVQRATSVDPRFVLTERRIAVVADICRRLDGIPLAIELAVGRLPVLGLSTLHARIKDRLRVAGGGRDLPARQQTMLATIAWSYDLLSEHERILMRRVGIFSGGFTLAAAEAVCHDEILSAESVADLLSSLADKSLVNVVLDGESTRYTLLESVATFALEQLARAGEQTAQARRHARWLAELADEHEADHRISPVTAWLQNVLAEIHNVRVALEWALGTGSEEDALLAGRIIGGLRGMWLETGRFTECTRWAEAAVARIDEKRHPRVALLLWRTLLQTRTGPAMFAAVQRVIPLSAGTASPLLPLAYSHLCNELCWYGRLDEAERAAEQALSIFAMTKRERSLQYLVFLAHRAWLRTLQGRLDEARADIAEGDAIASAYDEDFIAAQYSWFARRLVAAEIACCEGRPERAAPLVEEALARARRSTSGGRAIGGIFCHVAGIRLMLGDLDGAEAAGREGMQHARNTPEHRTAYWAIQHLAGVSAIRGRAEMAARMLGFVDAWREREGYHRGPIEQRSYDILVGSLREQLSHESLTMLSAAGSELSLEVALDQLLEG